MIMKSHLEFSDLYSRYGLNQILKLHFIGGSEKIRTMEKKPGTNQIGTS